MLTTINAIMLGRELITRGARQRVREGQWMVVKSRGRQHWGLTIAGANDGKEWRRWGCQDKERGIEERREEGLSGEKEKEGCRKKERYKEGRGGPVKRHNREERGCGKLNHKEEGEKASEKSGEGKSSSGRLGRGRGGRQQ